MKNRSFFMRAATVLACLCLVLTAAVTGTVAHYVSSTEGSDDITVATWEFEVNDVNFATNKAGEMCAQELAFDLFATIYDEGEDDFENGLQDDAVKAGYIAPGTCGAFEFVIDNVSEVDAKYTLEFTETNGWIPIQYSLDGVKWYDDFATINADTDNTKEVFLVKESGTKTVTVYWRWLFDGTDVQDGTTATDDAHQGQTDVSDTSLGILAAENKADRPSVTVTAKLTAVQVD